MKIIQYVIVVLLSALILGCANQTTPSGGDKDTIPPKLIQSNPPDRQINFNKDEIELTFDEAIQINNAREQILITPSIGKKFEALARKNKVTLKLNTTLSENTTYTISFRESIQDLTEKNSVTNFKLAFSTGPYIDSLSIEGFVYDIRKGTRVKNYTVAAFPYSDTLDIFSHEALWITLTGEKGEFTMDNLKAGEYILYAFDDKSKNLIVDSKTESYGFFANPINLQETQKGLEIPVLSLDTRPLKLISAKPLSSYYNIRFSKGISSYEITTDDSHEKIYSLQEDAETLKIYNTFTDLDSMQFRLLCKDSIENSIDTLLYLKFNEQSSSKEKFSANLSDVNYYESTAQLKGILVFNKPINFTGYDSIYIQTDSTSFIRFSSEDFKWNNNLTQLTLEKTFPKGTSFITQPPPRTTGQRRGDPLPEKSDKEQKSKTPLYNQPIFPKGTFISIEQDSSSTIQSPVTIVKQENSGTILIDVKTTEKIIVEILTKGYTVVKQSPLYQPRFDNLPPGDYQIRVIIDKNENGKWDPGNYFIKQEPEPIIYYKTENNEQIVNIKANWELGPLLITPQ